MVTGLDYAFDPISMTFQNISKEVMVRAVRVKSTLKGKLQKHLSFEEKKAVEEPTTVIPTVNENIEDIGLSEKLDALVAQGKVETKVKRMVLYTKDLAAKSERVMNKTLGAKQIPIEVSTDNVGIVSDDWDSALSTETAIGDNEEVKTSEIDANNGLDMEKTQTLEMPTLEMPSIENDVKVETPNTIDEVEEETKSIEMPSIESNVKVEIPNTIDEVDEETKNIEMPSMDFLSPEVSEPTEISSMENENSELNFNFLPTLEKEEPEPQSFEDNNSSSFSSFGANLEPKIEMDDMPSQSAVVAKARKFSNMLNEANSKVSDLQSKVGSLENKYSEAKDKNHVLESFVKDVVKENTRLVSENTQLKSEKQKLEDSIFTITETSKTENAIQAKNHADEVLRLNDEISILKEEHRAEKEKMEMDFKAKLQAEDERHKKAMRALYATISETLVEPTSIDDEMTKVA